MVRGLLYEKITTISEATNKDFREGQIMTLISKDANEADRLLHLIAAIVHMVLNTFLTFAYLSYFFGKSFMAVALVGAVAFSLNKQFSGRQKEIGIERERLSDIKNNLLSEMLNNIKMLKLYGWQPEFESRILNARVLEMAKYREQLRNNAVINSIGNFIVNVIPAISFSAFIGSGNVLDLAMALTAIDYFGRLMWGIAKWPETY